MTTPNVTETPLHLEPTMPDPFIQDEATASRPAVRELDHRRSDGIDIRLLWNEIDDGITVAVFDAKTGDAFQIDVAGHEAHDAFHHPYAYAAHRGGRR